MVSKGISDVCNGVSMLCGMGAIGCVRGGFVVEGALVRAACDIDVCYGRSVFFMYACHEGCISVVFDVGFLGSFLCSIPAGRSRVNRRVSMAVRSFIFGQVLLPWGSLARMRYVGCMWYMNAVGEVCLMVSRLFHL